jgi:hypothetical protein
MGIGTSSPGAKLDVRGTSTFLINSTNPTAWVSVDSGLTTQSMYMQVNTTSSDTRLGSYTSHPLVFLTNNAERMRIDSTGNLLLGTTSANTAPTGYISAANQFTFRNKLINGAMQVAQRATAATNVTLNGVGYTTVDRWFAYQNGSVGVQTSQVAPSLSQFQYCLKWGRPSGNTTTGTTVIGQALETVNSIELQNTPITLSFWAKCGANFSSTANALTTLVYTGTGADQAASLMVTGSWTGSATPINTTTTLTTSWQRFTYTATTGAAINQVGVYFNWNPTGTAGADDYVYITGLQLEKGPVVTAYETRPYATELALCQRYYWSELGSLFASGVAYDTVEAHVRVQYPVPMRTSPTVTIYDNSNNAARIHRNRVADHANAVTIVNATAQGFPTVSSTALTSGGGYSCKVKADAEL